MNSKKICCFLLLLVQQVVELISMFEQITDNVVSLDTADSASIGKPFQWVTASIGVSSTK
jgi:uncharacterized protein YegL